MKTLLLILLLTCCLQISAQKPFIRDFSIGYRIGEGDATGSDHFDIPSLLKKPAAFQSFLNKLDWNSLNGSPSPVTYHRLFLQGELDFTDKNRRFHRNTSIPIGINYAYRQKRSGMGIGNHFWYTRPTNDLLETKMYWIEQSVQFIGVHTGIHRKVRLGKKFNFKTGILLQGEIAINHRFKQWVDTSTYSRAAQAYIYDHTDALPTLKGRNFVQWSILFPLAAEINLYQKQWLVKPEITLGLLSNRYLVAQQISRESINAALWFIYRRP